MGLLSNRRRVLGRHAGLPYDAEVEYLENSPEGGGKAYINTGYVPTGTDNSIYCKFFILPNSVSNTYYYIFAASLGENYRVYRVYYNLGMSKMWLNVNAPSSSEYGTNNITSNNLYDIEISNFNWRVNSTSGILPTYDNLDENYNPIFLFAPQSLVRYTYGRLYSFKWVKGNTTVLDLIPVRKDGIGYMYDRVSGKLMGNNGEGKFICGPDKFQIRGKWVDNSTSENWWIYWNGSTTNKIDLTTFTNPDTKEFYFVSDTKPTSVSNLFYTNNWVERIDDIRGTDLCTSAYQTFMISSGKLNTVNIPHMDTSKCTNMGNMFRCPSLQEINANLDFSNVKSAQSTIFYGASKLTNVKGNVSNLSVDITLSYCPLTSESAQVFIDGLVETKDTHTITFRSTTYNSLSEEQKYQITDKGWNIQVGSEIVDEAYKNLFVIKGKFTDDSTEDDWWIRSGGMNTQTSIAELVDPITKEFVYKVPSLSIPLDSLFYKHTALDKLVIKKVKGDGLSLRSILNNATTVKEFSIEDSINASTMLNMLYMCNGLTSVDLSKINTSQCTTLDGVFYLCYNLQSVNLNFDFSSATSVGGMFTRTDKLKNITGTISNLKLSIILPCPLTNESAMVFINGLAEVGTAKTITFSKTTYATLTEEQIAIAERKGWIVESA